jgi:hypothetical protein
MSRIKAIRNDQSYDRLYGVKQKTNPEIWWGCQAARAMRRTLTSINTTHPFHEKALTEYNLDKLLDP